jgi:hypothetical protein
MHTIGKATSIPQTVLIVSRLTQLAILETIVSTILARRLTRVIIIFVVLLGSQDFLFAIDLNAVRISLRVPHHLELFLLTFLH